MKNTSHKHPPVICFVGRSDSGKTTLVSEVVQQLSQSGYSVDALKRASHGFQMDRPGKDTDRFRQAGARAVAIASDNEFAVISSTEEPMRLQDLVAALPEGADIVVCEGFSHSDAPKIGVHREQSPLPAKISGLLAIVGRNSPYPELPHFSAEDSLAICDFILQHTGLSRS